MQPKGSRRIRFEEFLPWKVLYFLDSAVDQSVVEQGQGLADSQTPAARSKKLEIAQIGKLLDTKFGRSLEPLKLVEERDQIVAEAAMRLGRFETKNNRLMARLVTRTIRCVLRYHGLRMKTDATNSLARLVDDAIRADKLGVGDGERLLLGRNYWSCFRDGPPDRREMPEIERFINSHETFTFEKFCRLIATSCHDR